MNPRTRNSPAPKSPSRYRLLVVDDEETMRRSLADILRLEGYQVQTAADGEAAMALIEQEAFDLVLLDLKMPRVDGLEVLRFASHAAPDTQIVLLTAHGSLESAIQALRCGAHDYLLKPASPQQILSSVKSGLGRRAESDRKRAVIEQLEASLRALKGIEEPALPGEETQWAWEWGEIQVDLQRRQIHWPEGAVKLTPTEGKLLGVFLAHPRRVFSHRELVLLAQGYETREWESPEVLRPLVSRLRRKLSQVPGGKHWIVSVRNKGYVFEPPAPTQGPA